MTIETKYNIGDEVWCTNIFGTPCQLKVYGAVIEILGDRIFTSYYVGTDGKSTTLEKDRLLFHSKEELLKSL